MALQFSAYLVQKYGTVDECRNYLKRIKKPRIVSWTGAIANTLFRKIDYMPYFIFQII